MSAQDPNAPRRRVYEFIEALTRIGAEQIVDRLSVSPVLAERLMDAIARAVVREFAKFQLYVPAVMEWELDPRNAKIGEQYAQPGPGGVSPFSRARVEQIAREYDRTPRQVYNVLTYLRESDARARQLGLPGLED